MSEQEYPEPDPTLSSDAQHSTYEAAPRTEEDDAYPPNGGGVIQTKGKPTETAAPKTTRTSRTASASTSGS